MLSRTKQDIKDERTVDICMGFILGILTFVIVYCLFTW